MLTRDNVVLDYTTVAGETPLDLAVKNGHRGVVRMLLPAYERAGLAVSSRSERLLQDGADEGADIKVGFNCTTIKLPWYRCRSWEVCLPYPSCP